MASKFLSFPTEKRHSRRLSPTPTGAGAVINNNPPGAAVAGQAAGAATASVPPAASPIRHLLFFDTETTGLPERLPGWNNYHPPDKLECYDGCRLVSLPLVLLDVETGRWETYTTLINPGPDVVVNPKALEKNKPTLEYLEANGHAFASCVPKILELFEKADLFIAHGFGFDIHALCSELFRAGVPSAQTIFDKALRRQRCTVGEARRYYTEMCGHSDYRQQPSTRLEEVFKRLTGRPPLAAHQALDDTLMLVHVYFALKKNYPYRVPIPEQRFFRLVAQPLRRGQQQQEQEEENDDDDDDDDDDEEEEEEESAEGADDRRVRPRLA